MWPAVRLGLSPLSPDRSVGPSSSSRVLPAPGRMNPEFAPPSVGPGFRAPTHRLPRAGIPAPGIVTKLSWAHEVSGVPSLTPPRPHPPEASRPGCSGTVASPARGSAEAAPRVSGPRRRPMGPHAAAAAAATAAATAAPAESRRTAARPRPREAQSRASPARRVPAAATSRAPLPRAARTGAESPLLARLSQLRGAGALPSLLDVGGDSLPLVDARGGNSLPGVTGTGGGDSPAGMTRWAGIPQSPALQRAESLRVNSEPPWALASEISVSWGGKDGARWQLRIYRWRGLGRHLGGRAGARGLEVAFAQHVTRH